ncbi:MAG: hypothetical protein EKK61_01925 [Rickettsiales bacterium]|nr:MAG: hypothetical protein EKK61_01925 [Rickettsiales bacterium]
MAIDSVNSIAQQSYMQVQNRPIINTQNVTQTQATDFQQMVNKQFNSFANLSPSQILERITNARVNDSKNFANKNSGIVSGAVSSLKGVIAKQENAARKSLIGEASLIDLLTTTTEAKNLVETMVKLRTELLAAFDKVMNMNM